MTRIQYIHGIQAAGEMTQRGAEVKSAPFIPYTALSRGEMRVALAAERAEIYAQAYPELREYRQAAALLNNALYTGVHGGRPLAQMGAIYDPVLQSAAQIIARSISQTKPASTAFIGRPTLAQGIVIAGIGAGIGAFTEMDCTIYARDMSNRKFGKNESSGWWKNPIRKKEYKEAYKYFESECQTINAVQQVVNGSIESSAHHLLYKSVNTKFPGLAGTRMDNKLFDHLAGIGGLSSAAFVSDSSLIDEWTENGIRRYNAQAGLDPAMSSQISGFSVASAQDASVVANYRAFEMKRSGSKIGEPVTIALVTALVVKIGAALAAAAAFQKALNDKRNATVQVAKGYGTPAFSSEEGDWNTPSTTPPLNPPPKSDNTMLLLGGLALGGLLLLRD